jgi:hypothetical protein
MLPLLATAGAHRSVKLIAHLHLVTRRLNYTDSPAVFVSWAGVYQRIGTYSYSRHIFMCYS